MPFINARAFVWEPSQRMLPNNVFAMPMAGGEEVEDASRKGEYKADAQVE